MDVKVLFFDGCPNWEVADARLREALKQAGRSDVRVEHHRVTTPEEAEAVRFRGSPTILVNGQDPFADPDAPVGLSCRVYRTDAGLAGAPTVEQLLTVLR
ncbi:DF family (seleno)protein [Trujillonella humicola]|uniref:DF family (seleno)protein n=1 Tax=Trujillonella humicola TaxID=3383699 RepID=UPI003906AD8A